MVKDQIFFTAFLASQDAIEVMFVTDWLEWVIVSTDFTDVAHKS